MGQQPGGHAGLHGEGGPHTPSFMHGAFTSTDTIRLMGGGGEGGVIGVCVCFHYI